MHIKFLVWTPQARGVLEMLRGETNQEMEWTPQARGVLGPGES